MNECVCASFMYASVLYVCMHVCIVNTERNILSCIVLLGLAVLASSMCAEISPIWLNNELLYRVTFGYLLNECMLVC